MNALEKFQELLRDIFQFESSDLDFGIYQLEEWERLGFGKFEREEDLEGKKLPIDTRYFDERFKWELLERISEKVNLDGAGRRLFIQCEV